MHYSTRRAKIFFGILIVFALCFALFLFSPVTNSQASSNFTLPLTINTYGNGWNGYLAYDLEITNGTVAGGPGNYLVVMDTNGNLMALRNSSSAYSVAYNIAPNTLLFSGEPRVDGAGTAPSYASHIWNIATNTTQDFPNVVSHHDLQYDPINNTFLTLQSYERDVGNNSYLFDKILQVDSNGTVLWSWDIYNYIPLSQGSIFNETTVYNGQTLIDFSHSNSLDWDYNNSIIYLNLRCTNTFYKINQTSGNLIWSVGEFGNFTLLDEGGNPVSSLWYHSHNTKQVAPNVFTMFDNDYNNVTNPNDSRSRMIELTVNETSMAAYINWSWEAPVQYWNSYAGGTVLLPNGDFLGDFGDPTHQFPQNNPWNFTDTGAVLVEVNPAGQVVKTFTFPVGSFIYRVAAVTNPAFGNFVTPTPSPPPTPTPVATPTPSPTPAVTPTPIATASPTPPASTKSPTDANNFVIIAISIVLAIVLAVVSMLFVFFHRKKRQEH